MGQGKAEETAGREELPLGELFQITTTWPHSPSCSYFPASEDEERASEEGQTS